MAARRMGLICLLLCVCFCLLPCSAQAVSTADAIEPIVPEQACALTLTYVCNGTPFEQVPVQLYRIASVSENAYYTPTAPFQATGLVLNGIQSATEWNIIRSTLEAHIIANAVSPDASAQTNQDGQAVFAGLEPGLYLVSSAHVVQEDGDECFFDSTLVALPGLEEDGRWKYQVAVMPKPDMLPPVTPDETLQWKVLKLWRGEPNQNSRPKRIEVDIYRNGVLDRTVTLSEDNHWSYTWETPKDNADWTVVERSIPDGYTAAVEERQTAFVLTNTWQPGETPPGENPPGETPPGENPPGETPPGETPPGETPPGVVPPADRPDTGDTPHIMLYTVLLYVSGAVLVLLGITGKRKHT